MKSSETRLTPSDRRPRYLCQCCEQPLQLDGVRRAWPKPLEKFYDKFAYNDAQDAMGQLPGLGGAGTDNTEPTEGSDQQERIRE